MAPKISTRARSNAAHFPASPAQRAYASYRAYCWRLGQRPLSFEKWLALSDRQWSLPQLVPMDSGLGRAAVVVSAAPLANSPEPSIQGDTETMQNDAEAKDQATQHSVVP